MADEDRNENLEEKDSTKGAKKSIVKWIICGALILILGAAGLGGWRYYETRLVTSKKAKVEPVEAIWSIGTVVVNLMDGKGDRYLKTTIQIEVSSGDCLSELDLLKPKIIDNILDLLSSKKYGEIVGFEGKQRLREEISMRLNSYLNKGRIKQVYFTEFIIQ